EVAGIGVSAGIAAILAAVLGIDRIQAFIVIAGAVLTAGAHQAGDDADAGDIGVDDAAGCCSAGIHALVVLVGAEILDLAEIVHAPGARGREDVFGRVGRGWRALAEGVDQAHHGAQFRGVLISGPGDSVVHAGLKVLVLQNLTDAGCRNIGIGAGGCYVSFGQRPEAIDDAVVL